MALGLVIAGNVVVFIVLLALLILVILFYLKINNSKNNCLNLESPFCYNISCPCDEKKPPCFGSAKRPVGKGLWRCSSSPGTVVDDKGNPTK